jgi:hypothetical protein
VKRAGARAVVGLLLVVIVATGAALWRMRHRAPAGAPIVQTAPDVHAPDSVRVRVHVLNGTKTRGLARRATLMLRDHGFDVVETGTDATERDTTIVYDVSGHPDWANRLAKLFPPARVIARPDSSRYLDVVVSIGSTWRAPTQPFYP